MKLVNTILWKLGPSTLDRVSRPSPKHTTYSQALTETFLMTLQYKEFQPKFQPGDSLLTSLEPESTTAVPDLITQNELPGSPSSTIICPFENLSSTREAEIRSFFQLSRQAQNFSDCRYCLLCSNYQIMAYQTACLKPTRSIIHMEQLVLARTEVTRTELLSKAISPNPSPEVKVRPISCPSRTQTIPFSMMKNESASYPSLKMNLPWFTSAYSMALATNSLIRKVLLSISEVIKDEMRMQGINYEAEFELGLAPEGGQDLLVDPASHLLLPGFIDIFHYTIIQTAWQGCSLLLKSSLSSSMWPTPHAIITAIFTNITKCRRDPISWLLRLPLRRVLPQLERSKVRQERDCSTVPTYSPRSLSSFFSTDFLRLFWDQQTQKMKQDCQPSVVKQYLMLNLFEISSLLNRTFSSSRFSQITLFSAIISSTFITLDSLLQTSRSQSAYFYSWKQNYLWGLIFFWMHSITCSTINTWSQISPLIINIMALLGKTLKGKSARPGGLPVKKNIKVRQIAKTQEEFDQLTQLAKMKRDILRSKIKNEQKIVSFNSRKLLTYWRKIMRIAKTQQLKNEIDVLSQNNQRQLDSNEAFIQMLDKNLDEAQDQFQIALRNHLIHTETLIQLQDARLRGLQQEFRQDSEYIITQYDRERQEMQATFQRQIKELENMIATMMEEDQKKTQEIKNDQQTTTQDTKNKDLEDLNHMKMTLATKQDKFYQELQQLHQKYASQTTRKSSTHHKNYQQNRIKSNMIQRLARQNVTKKAKIDLTKLKIIQHQKQCNARNMALKKENQNINRNYQELKAKMTKFRNEEDRRLKELTNNSKNAVEKLREYQQLGIRILKTAQICRRLQTEREKVLPFFPSTVDDSEIPEDLKNNFVDITMEEYAQFSYLDNFLKRYNKVLLDKLAIHKQKEILEVDNSKFKSLLKQYLNGISLNDQVMKSLNPLLVINHKINISKLPAERQTSRTAIQASQVINYTMMQLGYVPRQGF